MTARIDHTGRILIPLQLRRELQLTEDSDLILRVVDGELRMHTRQEALRRARERLKRLKKPGQSVTDEFLAERRQEAQRELEDLNR
ncbi:MAG: AbrB/MazE/SpoVT family DNA-binding domain-containing protein [Bryobacterales bacterium]|nr:AbrB/MazE/SpoVT family DNA-binding domain-containing protein [Bryobacterales bacterium]